MTRTCIRVPLTGDIRLVNQTIIDILKNAGFHEKNDNGEIYWKKGAGITTEMQFVKVEYAEKEVLLYGWLKAGMGSIEGKESDLKGFFNMIPKRQLLKILNKIRDMILSLGQHSVKTTLNT